MAKIIKTKLTVTEKLATNRNHTTRVARTKIRIRVGTEGTSNQIKSVRSDTLEMYREIGVTQRSMNNL